MDGILCHHSFFMFYMLFICFCYTLFTLLLVIGVIMLFFVLQSIVKICTDFAYCLHFTPDVHSCGTRGSPGEGGPSRCDHHEQTQSAECPQPDHDPTDLPSAQGMWKSWLMQTSTGANVRDRSGSNVICYSSLLLIVKAYYYLKSYRGTQFYPKLLHFHNRLQTVLYFNFVIK